MVLPSVKLPTDSGFTTWIPTIAPLIVLVGAMLTGYISINTDIALLKEGKKQGAIEISALDKYDRYLQHQSEGIERRVLVVETKQVEFRSTQIRLESKVDRILSELKTVGTQLTELSTINKQRNKGIK